MAIQLGYPHPDYLLTQLTARQLRDWHAYADLDPWQPSRDDDRLAVLMTAILAPYQRNPDPLPSPYFPYSTANTPAATAEEMFAYMHERDAQLEGR